MSLDEIEAEAVERLELPHVAGAEVVLLPDECGAQRWAVVAKWPCGDTALVDTYRTAREAGMEKTRIEIAVHRIRRNEQIEANNL